MMLSSAGYIAPTLNAAGETIAVVQSAAVQNTITFAFVGLETITGIILAVLLIPEPFRGPDDSEVGQGSGKKPDNDEVQHVLHQHNDQQAMKQGKRPRNTCTLWNEQVSKIKIQTRTVACSSSLRRA